jgi:hypothetical protein
MDAASSPVALEMLLARDAPALLAANVPHPVDRGDDLQTDEVVSLI